MFTLHDRPYSLCDRVSRREMMRIGGLNLLGLSLPSLLAAEARANPASGDPTFGRAKNVIYLWLQGGPPQHETFDPKPNAPVEIRGPFRPISTNVPGIQFGELLPRTAAMADKLAVVRSMSTDDNIHSSSGYWVLTGEKYTGGNARQIQPGDWPYFGSVVKMLKPSERVPALSSVWIPDLLRLNDNVRPAGQTGGFLGAQWDPDRFIGDPSAANYRVEGLGLQPDMTALRLERRAALAEQVGRHFDALESSPAVRDFDEIRQAALGLLTSGRAREAFEVRKEPDRVRARYGKNRWGQCVLLARRLIEAGVRLVHVGWPRDPGDTAIVNPLWDTHAQNADRLEDVLCPMFDVGYTALIEDLDQRGLLDETLVVAVAEFGRTPKINKFGGRDHWGHVFSFALAGAGIRGGQVFGSSDKIGGYPASQRVEPQDLTATMFHLLGIGHEATFPDRTGRPRPVSQGQPIHALLGTAPATTERAQHTVVVGLVPRFAERNRDDGGVEAGRPLVAHDAKQRGKTWQAAPVAGPQTPFGVALVEGSEHARDGRWHAELGIRTAGRDSVADALRAGAKAMLSQEVRNPRAGKYTFRVHASGGGSDEAFYRDVFASQFTCRLVIFGFVDMKKDHRQQRVFATSKFRPEWSVDATGYEPFEVAVKLRSQDGGANETSYGVGVAVVVEKTGAGDLVLPAGADAPSAVVRIDDVTVEFDPRPRDDSVVV